MARRLLLVRHADTGAQYAGHYVGATDVPLSDRGHRQAGILVNVLKPFAPTRCFRSPQLRAQQTADVIGSGLQLDAEPDDDLREIDFGQWEGLTFNDIANGWPETVDAWAARAPGFGFPDGETLDNFEDRVRTASKRLCAGADNVVLVISHGGVIRCLICMLLGLSPEYSLMFDVKPATITIIDLFDDADGVMVGLNVGLTETA